MSALPSTLDAVTVYREGAICRRLARVPPGTEAQLRFGGLPLSLEPGSLRARVVSGGGRVVDVRPQFDVTLADEVDVPVEKRALEDAQAALLVLQQRRARVDAEVAELQALAPAFLEHKRGDPPRPAPVDAMLALGDMTEAELKPRLERRRELDRELKDAHDEVALRQRRLQEASTAKRTERAQLSRVAVVTLAAAPKEPLALELEYQVPGARWVPGYSLTLERGLTGGVLLMRAHVAQHTGEDWSQVKLSLSTAQATRRADVPELKALKIGRRQEPPARSGWREPPPGLGALFETYDEAMRTLEAPPPPRVTAPQNEATRTGGFGGKAELARKPSAKTAPPPPPAPPAPSGMPMQGMASLAMPASMPAPSLARAAAPRPQAPQKKGMGFRARREEPADKLMEEMDEMAAAPAAEGAGWDSEESTGTYALAGLGGGGGSTVETELPGSSLDAALGDYARLCMAGPEAGDRRGKLAPASPWAFAFVAGVSVQVELVMAVVARAHRGASEVGGLGLPALCNPVTSVKSFDYRYDCAGRLDVPSTGKWALVPVMACAVGLAPEYVCVPSVEQKVYRTLTVTNRGTHALLPGPVDVTAGNEFLMTTSLPAIPPGAEQSHRLGLGVEEGIKVSRKTQMKETTGGFLGGSTVLPHELEIEINNRLSSPALIEVRERVPVAEGDEKDLKVEEAQVTPPWEKAEQPEEGRVVRGARRWRVTAQPGQPLKLSAQYVIRMPADRMLVGGNRRS